MISGIYETYAQMLESTGQLVPAYGQLMVALSYFGADPLSSDPAERISTAWSGERKLTQKEHLRAVALNQKLGQLALSIALAPKVTPYPSMDRARDGPTSYLDAAEMQLSSALAASLRIGLGSRASGGDASGGGAGTEPVVVGRDFQMPNARASSGAGDLQNLGITMEALAEVYARKGRFEYAQQLLVQAISTLLPPQEADAPPRDRCQAAMVSYNRFP